MDERAKARPSLVVGAPGAVADELTSFVKMGFTAFSFAPDRYDPPSLPLGVYTIPEVSSVGLSEDEARSRGIDPVVGRALFRNNARGAIIGDRDGLTKLVFDRATRALIDVIATGGSPRYIGFNTSGTHAVVANEAGWVNFIR